MSAIEQREQAGHTGTAQPSHGYTVTTAAGSAIAQPATLDELRVLADQLDELVWVGYRKIEIAPGMLYTKPVT